MMMDLGRPRSRDLAGQIMAYEAGQMTRAEVRELFQYLVDLGIVWKMRGPYGRMARILIERGEIQASPELRPPAEAVRKQPAGRTKLRIIAAILLAVLAFVLLAR